MQNFPTPLSGSHVPKPTISGVSLRTNSEAVGTGVLSGSNAMSGLNTAGSFADFARFAVELLYSGPFLIDSKWRMPYYLHM